MRRRMLAVVGLIGLLCSVAAAAKAPKVPAPDPECGAIGMTIKVKAQLAIGGALYATRVYLARVDEGGDPLRAGGVYESTFDSKAQVYLLNAKPGRYVLVGAQTPELRPSGGAPGAPPVTVVFDREMIPKTEVTVEAGKILFMGEIIVKTGASMNDADKAQRHYGALIGTKLLFGIHPGTSPGLDREPATERAFWEKAIKKVFDDGDGWSRLVQRRLDQAGKGS